jgi:hypothetical protein
MRHCRSNMKTKQYITVPTRYIPYSTYHQRLTGLRNRSAGRGLQLSPVRKHEFHAKAGTRYFVSIKMCRLVTQCGWCNVGHSVTPQKTVVLIVLIWNLIHGTNLCTIIYRNFVSYCRYTVFIPPAALHPFYKSAGYKLNFNHVIATGKI